MTTYKSKVHSIFSILVSGFLLTSSLPCAFAEHQLPSVKRQLQNGGPGAAQTTSAPSSNSTDISTPEPTLAATDSPTAKVTDVTTGSPTPTPTANPTASPTGSPTGSPTRVPTAAPVTPDPTPSGTLEPTESPTRRPTAKPTKAPPPTPQRTGVPTLSPLDDDQAASATPIEGRSISETVIIAVAAAGGGVVLLLAWAMFLKFRYRNKRKGGSSSNTKKTSTIANNYQSNMGNQETTAEILVPHGNDDVSTIGDPAGVYSGDSTAYERQKRMFDDDYSLNTASLERMIDVQSSQNDLPSYSESPSFNQLPVVRETPTLQDPGECFDIAAPPGKLGVILEEDSDDGVPVVHSIKDESPLVGQVLRGDRLCSIDGVDCSGKTPHEVAKLLKYKESAPSRILTFSRPTTR